MAIKNNEDNYVFSKKWSLAIAEHGFTALPNLLLRHYVSLGITTPELRMIIALETFRWDDKEPWPSVKLLGRLLNVTPCRARAILTCLDAKGLISRTEHIGDSNTYSFEKLIYRLDQLATSSLPVGRNEPPSWDETRLERRTKASHKEYEANQDPTLIPTINTGIEKVGKTLRRRYQQ